MALKDKIRDDIARVFMNMSHFAQVHYWNGMPIICVPDEDTALKRKNNNVVDISWDNNSTETVIYTPVEGFPGRAMPNEHVIFDKKQMRILQVQEDIGMYTILLASFDPKAVAAT